VQGGSSGGWATCDLADRGERPGLEAGRLRQA
jgi:hypothetical protein